MDRKTDAENLISTIKQYEAIWNTRVKEYHKKTCKEASWNQVCEELVNGWNELDEAQKTHRQGEIKKRWNNIRDYYKKDLALQIKGSIGQPNVKRNKYIFSKQLEFLRPVLNQSRTSIYEKTASDDETEEISIHLEENYSSDSETSHLLKRKKAIKLLEANNLEDSKTEEVIVSATRSTEIEEDSDLLFLKSLLPDMKMMSYSQKIDFKMGILKLCKETFKNTGEEYEDEDTKNPLS